MPSAAGESPRAMMDRIGSPLICSIFTTSAPQSPRAAAPEGTKPCSEKSRTLMPASGSVMDYSGIRGLRVNGFEERDDRIVEEVVAVAGDHVARAGHVDELRVRHELEELARAL